jgi:hypothetical protein
MLTVFLSVRGAVLINWLPPQAKFNSTYFCQNLLEALAHILHIGRNTHSGRPSRPADDYHASRPINVHRIFGPMRRKRDQLHREHMNGGRDAQAAIGGRQKKYR